MREGFVHPKRNVGEESKERRTADGSAGEGPDGVAGVFGAGDVFQKIIIVGQKTDVYGWIKPG